MIENIASKLNIVFDGMWSQREILIAAAAAVLVVLVILLIAGVIRSSVRRRKKHAGTIFSHRKNKYKDRIGKKIKF